MKSRPKLANATQLTNDLWIGGQLDPVDRDLAKAQLDELVAVGITSIVDTRIEACDIDWVTEAKAEIDYLSIGVDDAGFVMPDEWWIDGTTYALEQISEGHVVLAHCQAGINRGPSMGFAILIAQAWDAIEALNLIRSHRPIARIAYAEQAIDWWLSTTGADDEEVTRQIRRIKKWRIDNNLARGTEVDGTWMGK